MRVLLTTTRGAGHFHPLLPFAHGEVLAAGPTPAREMVEGAGLEFWELDPPPEDVLDEVWSRVPALPPDEANAVVIRDIFADLNLAAALPGVRAAIESFRPDVVVREVNEYAGALAAELAGIPSARVAIGLSSAETLALSLAAAPVHRHRRALGLDGDPGGERMRTEPYLTCFPASFEDPEVEAQPDTRRAAPPAEGHEPLPDWWDGSDAPLIYMTFGTVAGSFEPTRRLYEMAMACLAGLDARVLLTLGPATDERWVADAPANVHVERWIPQARVLAQADAMISHGGSGTVLGALTAGVPQVVLPLFADQPFNAARVAATGAGVVVSPPDPGDLRAATERVLGDAGIAAAARAMAAEVAAAPPAPDVLAQLVG